MCAILNANVADEVFGDLRPEAGAKFFEWLNSGPGRLVLGGRLRDELNKTSARNWLVQAVLAGRVRSVSDTKVDARTKANKKQCKSDDPHVIALAQVSHARLLYSNDRKLHQDFKDKSLIDAPRGSVYSTFRVRSFSISHRRLLSRTDLCRSR